MESNGPETKVRGPAAVIYERYLQLARDATSSGDRVLGENYLQHADHYFRLVRSMQPAQPHPQQQQQDRFNDAERDSYEEGSQEVDRAAGGETTSAEGDEQPDAEFPQTQQSHGQDREGGNRRRGRRNRFRPEGGEGVEAREGGGGEDRTENRPPREPRAEGEAREPRRERAPREERESAGPEGFSNGPKPAFLRGD